MAQAIELDLFFGYGQFRLHPHLCPRISTLRFQPPSFALSASCCLMGDQRGWHRDEHTERGVSLQLRFVNHP